MMLAKIEVMVKTRENRVEKPKQSNSHHPHFGNCWEHFDHFLKFISCVLYLVSKLGKSGVHRFKQCSIWSETKKLWPFEDDYAKLNTAAPHFATV